MKSSHTKIKTNAYRSAEPPPSVFKRSSSPDIQKPGGNKTATANSDVIFKSLREKTNKQTNRKIKYYYKKHKAEKKIIDK